MEVENIGVVGAGVMGHGIAHVAAVAGFKVKLYDVEREILQQAWEKIESNMRKGVERGKLAEKTMREALSQIELTEDFEEAVKNVDLVIEASPEVLEIKTEIFKKLDALCPPHTVLASNTSAKSITELGSFTSRPDRVISMHFFNPAHIMRLVEIVRGLETSDETFQIAKQAAEKMGKETVEISEAPGFVTSRMSALVGNEAFYMLMEGLGSPEDIDRAVRLGLNYPMGPLELADLTGLDILLDVLEYLHETLGEKFRPCPLLVKYVKAGRLGRKTGRGVYEYR